MEAVLDKGCLPRITVAATHGLLVGDAVERFASLPVSEMILTDSLPESNFGTLPVRVVSLRKTLAREILKLAGYA